MMVVTDWVCFLWTLHTQVLLISRRGLDDGIGREGESGGQVVCVGC